MNRWQVAGALLGVTSAAVLGVTMPVERVLTDNAEQLVGLAAAYGLLLATSGWVVRGALWFAGAQPDESQVDTGRAIGKVENVLVLTFALLGAYTALTVAFAAKSIVRYKDVTSGDTTYYLTGSITNVTYSLLYGVFVVRLFDGPPL
ncbi:hypothetical protein ACKVMT_17965 [Halobacteriales archaeon Cl-PHB]